AFVDLEDLRRNATEGIHGACAGGVWQAVVFGFGGLQLTDQGPVAQPHLPTHWTRLKFKVQWHDREYEFDLRPATTTAPLTLSKQIQGFIFDLDGVLTDTAEFHYRAWQRLADEEGLPFDRQANEALRGVDRRESLMRIIGDRSFSEAQIQTMMERKNRYYLEFIEEISPDNLLSGAGELLDELRLAGIKVAIGSASKNAHMVLERLGILDRVDAVADGYSVSRSKPAPDLFLHAAEQIGVAPSHCVVVEDAASGIEAGLAAGMWTIGLGPVERVGAAHLVLPNLAGVHWVDLQAKLDRLAVDHPLDRLVLV
ncbi:MAG TPA: beta-phosphoglucomutase, partial [Allocoleopsis sp.]